MLKSTPVWKKYTTAGFVVVTVISYGYVKQILGNERTPQAIL